MCKTERLPIIETLTDPANRNVIIDALTIATVKSLYTSHSHDVVVNTNTGCIEIYRHAGLYPSEYVVLTRIDPSNCAHLIDNQNLSITMTKIRQDYENHFKDIIKAIIVGLLS